MQPIQDSPCSNRFLAALCALALSPLLAGCERFSPGERLWRKHCADCHGLDGAGNTPRYMGNQWANLTDNEWKSGSGDENTIIGAIRDGVYGDMPGFSQLSDQEVDQIVDYLFYLRGENR